MSFSCQGDGFKQYKNTAREFIGDIKPKDIMGPLMIARYDLRDRGCHPMDFNGQTLTFVSQKDSHIYDFTIMVQECDIYMSNLVTVDMRDVSPRFL